MKKIFFNIILIFLLFVLNSCVIIKELIPSSPSASFKLEEINNTGKLLAKSDDINEEMFFVKGYNEPHTPPNVEARPALKRFLLDNYKTVDLNRSTVIKYYNKTKTKTREIIILIPGIYSGAGTLSNLSFSLARRLSESEIWIWERRSNQFEDRRIILKSLTENNPKLLTDLLEHGSYNFKNKENTFYQPATDEISFMGYWGIEVMLNDLYYVVKEARKHADQVVLAGYSLGAIYATLFAANNFSIDNEKTAGYKLVDKIMLLDGPPMIDGYIKTEAVYKNGAVIIPYNVIEGKDKLESGKYYPCSGSADRDMSTFFRFDMQGALAQMSPDSLSNEPYRAGSDNLAVDNLSKYLLQFDDNYLSFKLFSATFGRALAKQTGNFNYKETVKIRGLAPDKDKISWIARNENDKTEFNDYKEYLKAANHKFFNMAEWYQPTRILLDIGSIHHNDTTSGWQEKYFNFIENKNIDNPFLCIGLTRGLISNIRSYLDYKKIIASKDFTIVMIHDITHLDGNTITDNSSRPVIADVISNWLNEKELVDDRKLKINSKAYYRDKMQ